MKSFNLLIFAAMLVMLGSCGTTEQARVSGEGAGTYKVGKPYQIKGEWYYPAEDFSYDETGIASWYGPGFHGKSTANGEIYDSNELTAAHPTLPMPSLARVTNLDNGRSVVVRINDRGPYKAGRVIDVSRRTAQLLGFENQGTAKVRVQVMTDESRAIAQAAKTHGASAPETLQVASASAPRASEPSVEVQALPSVTPSPVQVVQPQEPKIIPLPKQYADSVLREPPYNAPAQPVVTQVAVPKKSDIYVQAGAFTKQENASKLKARLGNIAQTNIMQAVVNGREFYRVRLGPVATVDQADYVLQQVVRAGVPEPRIVID
ncbi:MAG: septal ring lytic transglycosylase RlpA family protein [Alphaproteobacteria bacterium]|nr:septal ring lytic transglycosylase RlpA family protein [Alphaproteobacteria bacterium]